VQSKNPYLRRLKFQANEKIRIVADCRRYDDRRSRSSRKKLLQEEGGKVHQGVVLLQRQKELQKGMQ
jgi:hypothetical protein